MGAVACDPSEEPDDRLDQPQAQRGDERYENREQHDVSRVGPPEDEESGLRPNTESDGWVTARPVRATSSNR